MTTFDRFDPFERRIGEALEGIAPQRQLDYLDDVFRQTARMSQRPRWSFPERWFNVDTTLARPMLFGRRVPLRSLMVLVVLAALLAVAGAVYVGSQKKLPAPLGPAANGQLTYGIEGDIYVRDTITGESRLLLGGPSEQGGVVSSPDGRLIAYDNVERGADHVWVANADGTNPRQILDRAFDGRSAQWSYDSRSMVVTTSVSGAVELFVAPADGSGAREIELPGLVPWDAVWDPQRPGVLLVRAEEKLMKNVDFYYVDTGTGQIVSKLEMGGNLVYGPEWEFRGHAFSPDGRTIAYNSVEREATGEHFWLRLIDRDGTNDRAVALPAGMPALYSQAWAVFSPDGKWIAMESWVTGTDGSSTNQIALAATDGSTPTRRIGPVVAEHSLVKIWSPDGTKIVMHVDTIDDLYVIDPMSGEYELLPWKSDFPDWQRVAP